MAFIMLQVKILCNFSFCGLLPCWLQLTFYLSGWKKKSSRLAKTHKGLDLEMNNKLSVWIIFWCQELTLKNMNGDVVSQFWVDIWAVVIVKVTGIDSCIRDLGTLNQKLGHCLWPRHNNGTHTTSAATELNSLKMFNFLKHFEVSR